MNESQSFVVLKPFAQVGVQAFVFLDGGELIDRLQQMLGKRTEAGANLQRLIVGLQVGGLGDAA